MNKNTEYELFTQEVYKLLAHSSGLEASSVQHDVKLKGKSGQEHQVDVYWEYKKDGVVHRVAIECKNYNQKISIGKVRDFFGVLYDVGNIRGVMACKKGYQDGAKKFADYYGISLKELRTPRDGETVIGDLNILIQGNIKRRLYKIDEEWAANHNLNISEYKRRLDSVNFDSAKKWSLSNHVPMQAVDDFIRDEKGNEMISIDELEKRTPDKRANDNAIIYCLKDSYVETNQWGLVKINEIKFEKEDIDEHRTYVLDAGEFVKAIIKDAQNGRKLAVLGF